MLDVQVRQRTLELVAEAAEAQPIADGRVVVERQGDLGDAPATIPVPKAIHIPRCSESFEWSLRRGGYATSAANRGAGRTVRPALGAAEGRSVDGVADRLDHAIRAGRAKLAPGRSGPRRARAHGPGGSGARPRPSGWRSSWRAGRRRRDRPAPLVRRVSGGPRSLTLSPAVAPGLQGMASGLVDSFRGDGGRTKRQPAARVMRNGAPPRVIRTPATITTPPITWPGRIGSDRNRNASSTASAGTRNW